MTIGCALSRITDHVIYRRFQISSLSFLRTPHTSLSHFIISLCLTMIPSNPLKYNWSLFNPATTAVLPSSLSLSSASPSQCLYPSLSDGPSDGPPPSSPIATPATPHPSIVRKFTAADSVLSTVYDPSHPRRMDSRADTVVMPPPAPPVRTATPYVHPRSAPSTVHRVASTHTVTRTPAPPGSVSFSCHPHEPWYDDVMKVYESRCDHYDKPVVEQKSKATTRERTLTAIGQNTIGAAVAAKMAKTAESAGEEQQQVYCFNFNLTLGQNEVRERRME